MRWCGLGRVIGRNSLQFRDNIAMSWCQIAAAFGLCLRLASVADAQPLAIIEYSLPPLSGPWGITLGPDGNIWFAETISGKIGRMTPQGELTEFQVDGGPIAITAGPDGNIWFTGYNEGIGKSRRKGLSRSLRFRTNLSPTNSRRGRMGISGGPSEKLPPQES
jgi:streptogramin lyase